MSAAGFTQPAMVKLLTALRLSVPDCDWAALPAVLRITSPSLVTCTTAGALPAASRNTTSTEPRASSSSGTRVPTGVGSNAATFTMRPLTASHNSGALPRTRKTGAREAARSPWLEMK